MIVFCDDCNEGYHQYCHKPAIDKEYIDVPDKEWRCVRCEAERNGEALPELPAPETEESAVPTPAEATENLVPGTDLTAEEV